MKTILVSLVTLTLVACSSSKESQDPSSDPITNSSVPNPPQDQDPTTPGETPDASSPTTDAAPKPPTNQAECIAACEAKHPTSAKANHALDTTCMLGTCEPVCNGLGTGKLYPPDADADGGVLCDTAAAKSYPISTPSAACSTCLSTTPACCTIWISIFGSADGQALSACANKCYVDFTK